MCIYPKLGDAAWSERCSRYTSGANRTPACRCACYKYCCSAKRKEQEQFQGVDWQAARDEARPVDSKRHKA